jgi:hypothetical protein
LGVLKELFWMWRMTRSQLLDEILDSHVVIDVVVVTE